MFKITIDDFFAKTEQPKSRVFMYEPPIFTDSRGFFCELAKKDENSEYPPLTEWMRTFNWIRQINRSSSLGGVARGCHAQRGRFCQGKMVSAINRPIYDIIADGRPDSATFGKYKAYLLDPNKQNMLWVPRGFLHGFYVPETDVPAIFEYMCDNVYDKSSEFSVNPAALMPSALEGVCGINGRQLSLSEKDTRGLDFEEWKSAVKRDFEETGKAWYI